MEAQEQEGMHIGDGPVETVLGAGRVGIIAQSYEVRHQRVVVAGTEPGMIRGGSDTMLVSRGEAARGMAHLEQRAAQAIAGTAAQTAQAMDRLAGQAASAVQQTAESSQRAISHLEGETRAAFGRTEIALGSMREELVSNKDKLTALEHALVQKQQRHAEREEKMWQEQNAIVADLCMQLDEAHTRVDRLSADLAKERSMHDVPPMP